MSKGTFRPSSQIVRPRGPSYAEAPDSPSPHFWWADCGYWSIIKPVSIDVYNQIQNPSFELGVDGWTITATATLTTIDTVSAFGRRSAIIEEGTFTGIATLKYTALPFPVITLNQGQSIYFTVWVKSGTDTKITASFEYPVAPGQNVTVYTEVESVKGTGEWLQVYSKLTFVSAVSPASATLDVFPRVSVEQTGLIQPFIFYVDGAMATIGAKVDAYFDGSTGGGTWLGDAHASASALSRFTRGSGAITNFTEIGLDIIGDSGWGVPPVEGVTSSYATTIGRHFQRQKYLPRTITLIGVAQGGSPPDLPQKRRAIQASFLYKFEAYCNSGLSLSYQPISPCCEALGQRVEARGLQYAGGMEGDRDNLYFERLALKFASTFDPFWTNPTEIYIDTDPSLGTGVELQHNSTAPVFPRIQLMFFGVSPTVQSLDGDGLINDTIFQAIRFVPGSSITLNPGEFIVLDTDPQNFSFVSSLGTDYSYLIDYESSTLGLPMIVPGVNSLRADFDGPVAGGFEISWIFNEKFLSADDMPGSRRCGACGSNF